MSIALLPSARVAERTPLDWRDVLLGRLYAQRERIRYFERYYDGEHPMLFATSKFREAFGNLFATFADNWCQIVVDAAVERLKVIGFEVDGKPNEDAWALWQASALDVESVVAHTEAGKTGQAYLLVDPSTDPPRITVEHAGQVLVIKDPADRRRRLAAIKHWLGDDGWQYLTLYLPDRILKWDSGEPSTLLGMEVDWRPLQEQSGPNPLGVVPIIALENKPALLSPPHSDLESAIPLQNAVNKLCSDMIVTSEYGAFPQRVVTGVEIPENPSELERAKQDAAMSRLHLIESPDASVISLPAADLSNYTGAIEMLIQHLAAQTRTPPHYLLASMINTSGDALSVAEAGLVSKCRAKALFFSDAWEEAIALALSAAGRDTAATDCEAIWSNPERLSQAQLTDAGLKKQTLGVPNEQIWLELGYTPQKIAEWSAAAAAEEKAKQDALAANPPPQLPPPPQPGPPPLPPPAQ